MANWIKSRKQTDGSFAIVVTREIVGTDGNTAIIEDFITRSSPLEFANAILRAHGVEPAHVFSTALMRDSAPDKDAILRSLGAEPSPHHAIEAPMPPHYDDEPPLRACPTGSCGMDD